jgi:hypothetical protein
MLSGAVRLRPSSLGACDDFYPAVWVRVERADPVFFDEAGDLLGIGGGEDERAVEN